MSAYKKFLQNDILVTPYTSKKTFTFTSDKNSLDALNILSFRGQNTGVSLDNINLDIKTTLNKSQYLVYKNIEQLYYSNYISSSIASGSFFNYDQSSYDIVKTFPTGSNEKISIISIPQDLFGIKVVPSSFSLTGSASGSIIDDGKGNLLVSGSSNYVGNIIYPHGMIIFTSQSYINTVQDDYTASYQAETFIFENQYKCTIREYEFNYSQSPTTTTGSEGDVYGYITGSDFAPYITCVGLYNEAQELLAVGKLAQPVPTSRTSDLSIIVRFDT